jgi:hypothetical protein
LNHEDHDRLRDGVADLVNKASRKQVQAFAKVVAAMDAEGKLG